MSNPLYIDDTPAEVKNAKVPGCDELQVEEVTDDII